MKAKNTGVILEVGQKVLAQSFPDRNFERVLCSPKDAADFCKKVRIGMGGVSKSTDFDILWAMLNWRKRGELGKGK